MLDLIKKELLEQYIRGRAGMPDGVALTLLHISDKYTTTVSGMDNSVSDSDVLVMPIIGITSISDKYFKHNPPTESEIENAIMIVEDEVMPLRKRLPLSSRLITFDNDIRQIAKLVANAEPIDDQLSITDMESVFTRLAAIITGRPSSFDTLPTDNRFAARLLILREFMHHIGFDKIELRK